VLCSVFCPSPVAADDLEILISGVQEPILGNVRSRVEPFRLTGTSRLSERRVENMRQDAERNARRALRPYGYYFPEISSRAVMVADRAWRIELDIVPGPPVIISSLVLEVRGPGADLRELQEWLDQWPLREGGMLVQPDWDREVRRALEIAGDSGYLLAEFTTRRMEVDLDRKRADLALTLETGEQAVMGEVRFHQDIVKPYIMENLPRFAAGDPYDAWILERFRIDVWRTGYFTDIEVVEDRHLEESPQRVDLDVTVKARKPNTYQGTIGIGSDTGPRIQLNWLRHLVSSNGDNLSLGVGWQEHNDEFFVRGGYRVPRNVESRQFWIAEALFKRENEDLNVSNQFDEELFTLGNADITDYSIRLGRQRVYQRRKGHRQLFETMFVQSLYEQIDYRFRPEDPPLLNTLLTDESVPLQQTSTDFSVGIEYEMPFIRGAGFETVGLNNRGWAFISDDAWGSDTDFTQIYLSSRWNVMAGKRWKFLLRGEAGYSDAEVNNLDVVVDDQLISLSVTQLPNLYRFKAGGSNSVRGYSFERLSNNNIGSNNIVTASAEMEMKVFGNWSAAAFFDIGNAFNDWDEMELKKGVGVGIRWYTIAGALRLDVAQALDLPGDPWRFHFTIGTALF
jgi:translocation and assembly module TamA